MDEIEIEDFIKLDLRIAKVIHAETVEEAVLKVLEPGLKKYPGAPRTHVPWRGLAF